MHKVESRRFQLNRGQFRLNTSQDVNGALTTYNYSSTSNADCQMAFPTSISEPLSLSRSMTWNCTGGVQTQLTDENSKTVTTAYLDPYFWRPASVTDQAGAMTNFCYAALSAGACPSTPSSNQVESYLNFNSGSSTSDSLATLDGLGRVHVQQTRQSPSSSNFDSVETDYDSLGRPSRVTVPYVGTAGQTNATGPAVTAAYDALGRVSSTSDSGGGSTLYTYNQNDLLVAVGPAPSGENTKQRQLEYDSLGRLTSVCEITSGTTAWPAGTCAQNTSQWGYWTKYTYDALGHLTGVTQNAQASSTQSRTFSYDLMGRQLSETNPESGTTTYTYDTDSTCGTSDGDLVKRVDAVGNVNCYSYDALHRPLTITYPSGSYSSTTPQKHFVYDSATVNSIAMAYAKSRLAEAYTCFSPCTTKLTDIGLSYSVRGQPSDIYESTPHSGMYYHVSEQYWANGALEQLSGLSALPTFTFTPDGEGRLYQASVPPPGPNPVTNTVFNSASLPTAITYGSSDSDSYSYGSNTDRITQYQFNVNGQSLTGALTWNANHTLGALNITDALNSADTQSCSFSHDDLTRLTNANCGSVWSQTFSYDPFGNLSSSGSMSFQPTYSVSTNRMTSVGSFTPTYDANGNTTADPSNTYSWDSAGKAVSITGVNLTYDALGRMVEQNRSGAYTQIVYGPNGGKFALMSGSTLQKAIVPLPGGSQAVYTSSGLLYYGHSDHLGSVRLGSSSTRTVVFDMAYAPFGETYATSGSTDPAFTTQRQDTVAGIYDFPAREYVNYGRWQSPDPSGLSAVHPRDPQTLNRYAYVRNNPLASIDPQGLDELDVEDDGGGCVISAFAPVRSSHKHAHANDDGCDPGGGGGGGGSDCGDLCDPTSGGDPNNSGGDVPLDPNGGYCDICLVTLEPGLDNSGDSSNLWQDGTSLQDLSGLSPQPADDTVPSYYADDVLNQLAPGVVRGAGVIGDPRYIAGFYVSSALLGSLGAAALDLAAGPEQSVLFGRFNPFTGGFPGYLNSNGLLRIGFGWNGSQVVFRITGTLVGGTHLLDWPWP